MEEEYTELIQLLEDISSYRRDVQDVLLKEKEEKRQKELDYKRIAEEMRSAMETISRRYINVQLLKLIASAERKRRREKEREKENDMEDDQFMEEDEFDDQDEAQDRGC